MDAQVCTYSTCLNKNDAVVQNTYPKYIGGAVGSFCENQRDSSGIQKASSENWKTFSENLKATLKEANSFLDGFCTQIIYISGKY